MKTDTTIETPARNIVKIEAYTYRLRGLRQLINCDDIECRDERIKRLKRAEYYFTKAIVLDKGFTVAFYNRGVVREKLAILYRNSAKNNNHITAKKYNYLTAKKNNYISGALEDINKAIAMDRKLTQAYFIRGMIKDFMGDYKGMKEDFKIYDVMIERERKLN